MKVNLHTHSTVSDGKLSPNELVSRLHQDGVEIFALTDHDKLDGLPEAQKRANELGIKLINGIEITTRIFDINIPFLDESVFTLHMLGLNFDYNQLLGIYREIDALKAEKLRKLNQKLIDNGYAIPKFEHITRRVTLAKALVQCGYSKDEDTAFENIINPLYERWSDSVGVKTAVKMIHNAGGKLLWAHPFEILQNVQKYTLSESQIDYIADQLKLQGVDGIEVYYQKYNSNQVKFLKTIQKKYDFISSAGTDYHAKDSQPTTFIDIDHSLIQEVLK